MRRFVEVYAIWVDHPPTEPAWTCGSGYLIGGTAVLTSAHVVCPDKRAASEVEVRAENGKFKANIVWWRLDDDHDAAIVVVTDKLWEDPRPHQPLRWGRFVTSRAGQACEAVGYPDVVAVPRRRDSLHASGKINPLSLSKPGWHAIEVDNHPEPPTDGRSRWAGMSGAGVICPIYGGGELLVGVVVVDSGGFASRQLESVPVSKLLADETFTKAVARYTGTKPSLEPVELAGLIELPHQPESPAGLLRADVAIAPFHPRPELDTLIAWCNSSAHLSTRLVTGVGGQGKTRLALELGRAMSSSGWSFVVIPLNASADQIAILGDTVTATIVVIDYAEGRSTQLDQIYASARNAQGAIRVLLLARTAGAWRADLTNSSTRLDILADDRIIIALEPIETTASGQADAWLRAIDAYANALSSLPTLPDIDWRGVANDVSQRGNRTDPYRTTLDIQIAALTSLLQAGTPVTIEATEMPSLAPSDILLRHEDRYWSLLADQYRLPFSASMRRCLVAIAALWGAPSHKDATLLLSRIHTRLDDETRTSATEWLAALYQDKGRYWGGLHPDPLAEHLITNTLTGGRCNLIPEDFSHLAAEQAEQALTILGRASVTQPNLRSLITSMLHDGGMDLAPAAITVALQLDDASSLVDGIASVVAGADLVTLQSLSTLMPRFSLRLTGLRLMIEERKIEYLRADMAHGGAYTADFASSLSNLAIHLAEAGRRDDALTIAQEAVQHHRELAAFDRFNFLTNLADSLVNLANHLAEVGRHEEARAVAEEALAYHRELAELNHSDSLPSLALSITSVSHRLSDTGHPNEALAAAHEAVKLYRQMVDLQGIIHLPELAIALTNLAIRQGDSGHLNEGLASAQEAVRHHRELATHSRDTHLPYLATSLNNLTIRLSEAGLRSEALTIAREAVAMFRELVEVRRDAYYPELAAALGNLAIELGRVNRRTEALSMAQEAVAVYRELVILNRGAYLPRLAMSVNNLANFLGGAEQRAEAVIAAQEAVNLNRDLVNTNGEAFVPEFARSLSNLAIRFAESGRDAEALATGQEALTLRRELAALNRDAYLPDLASSLNNFANHLSTAGRYADALVAAQEAVTLRRELVEVHAMAYLPDLALSVRSLAAHLANTGHDLEATVAAQEAIFLFTLLAEAAPEPFRDQLRVAHELMEKLRKR